MFQIHETNSLPPIHKLADNREKRSFPIKEIIVESIRIEQTFPVEKEQKKVLSFESTFIIYLKRELISNFPPCLRVLPTHQNLRAKHSLNERLHLLM